MTIETLTVIIIGIFITLPIILVLLLINEINKQKRPKTKYKVRTRKVRSTNRDNTPNQNSQEEKRVLQVFQYLGVVLFLGRLLVYFGTPVSSACVMALVGGYFIVHLATQPYDQKSHHSGFNSLHNSSLNSLQIYLTQLVHGDQSTAIRLVNYERSRYPGKSEEWYWKSAVERLIKDRR